MPTNVTRKELQKVFEAYSALITRNGLVHEGRKLILEMGSSTYGRAYRLYETAIDLADGGGFYSPRIGSDYLGKTASEAYRTLHERMGTVSDPLYSHPYERPERPVEGGS